MRLIHFSQQGAPYDLEMSDNGAVAASIICGRYSNKGQYFAVTGSVDGIDAGVTVCGELSRYPELTPTDSDVPALVLNSDASTMLAWFYAVAATLDDESGRDDLRHRFYSFVASEEEE